MLKNQRFFKDQEGLETWGNPKLKKNKNQKDRENNEGGEKSLTATIPLSIAPWAVGTRS